MKKNLFKLMALAIAAMTFAACEDVPEPYPTPGTQTEDPNIPAEEEAYLNETFESSFGSFTNVTIKGTPWVIDYKTAKATGYENNETTASEAYLVSKPIDLSQSKEAYLEFEYILRYVRTGTQNKVLITNSYTGDPTTTAWTDITGKLTEGSDWSTFYQYQMNLPASMIGQKAVVVALYYSCTTTSSTIEIKNLKLKEGSVDAPSIPSEEIVVATIAEFNAAAESTNMWYQLTGTVKNLKDGDLYGNFDLEDATGSVYVYGLLSEKGGEKKLFQELASKYGIKNGCKLTLIGNRSSYQNAIQVANAYFVSVEGGSTPDPGDGKGTEEDPYTVDKAIAAASGTGVYVKGYIVGNIEGQVIAEGARFADNGDSQTNLLIAASANETNVNNCMPVQLPSGAIRTGLNLKDNPTNYKKEVILYGNIEKYFGVTGIKSVTFAILDGKEIGTKPGGGSETPSGDVKKVSIADFNAAAESTDVWYQLTGTVKNLKEGDQYGNFDLEDATGSVFVYGVLSEKGGAKKLFQELVAKYGIKEGSKITIIGNRGSYNGKIEVMNAYFVSIEGGSGNTGDNEVKVVSVADFNAAAESNDVWYQLTGTIKNLKDNDQYGNFDLEDATGSVYVYGVLSEKGGAKKLFQELVAKYGIKNGSKITIIGNRGSYNGKIEVMNAYFVKVE